MNREQAMAYIAELTPDEKRALLRLVETLLENREKRFVSFCKAAPKAGKGKNKGKTPL